MKYIRLILCVLLITFLLFSPGRLSAGAQRSYEDTRFVREKAYRGVITIYHIVRHRPYSGSLSNCLQKRADEYEKSHRGSFISVEGISEEAFYERLEHGRRADAYSFFAGSVYRDLLCDISERGQIFREGLFQTDKCIPYCYSGYAKLVKNTDSKAEKIYYCDEIMAARQNADTFGITETAADTLYLDLRRAGDLMRYKDGFAQSVLEPVDAFSDAVAWFGIDRDTDADKTAVIEDFIDWLLREEQQIKLNALGLMSVRADVRNTPPETVLKPIFKAYETVRTVDPFLWYEQYDALKADATAACCGEEHAISGFQKRFEELIR